MNITSAEGAGTAVVFPFPNTQTETEPCEVCEDVQRIGVSAPGLLGSLAIPCPACTARGSWLLRSLTGCWGGP